MAISQALRYTITPVDPAAHLFEVLLHVARPDPAGQRLALPAWIPGSYLIREYARHFVSVSASAGDTPV
ncbi:MAG: peptidase M61, partial [Rhodocyclaceae bacterium]|nr:peptidase M61 [Rhodocyclaceae bacterium]